MRNLILTLIIWIICFTAITAGASLTYIWYSNRGQDIKIHFQNVEGLLPKQSKIMYLGVQIGNVTDIHLNLKSDLPTVHARITKRALKLLGNKSKFWIVRPEVDLGAIRNQGTIASGNYIGFSPAPGSLCTEFTALEEAPIEDKFGLGLRLTLQAQSAAGLEIGSAILYRDFQIGEISDMELSLDKRFVLVKIFIQAQYANVIRKDSYFANVSGFHASIHLLSGSEIGMNSFKSLIKGAITVTTPNLGSPLAKNEQVFNLLTTEQLQKIKEG